MPCLYCARLGCEVCPRCIHHVKCLGCNRDFDNGEAKIILRQYICPECEVKYINLQEPTNYSYKGLK